MSTTRSLGREAITVSSADVTVPMHRTDGTPTLFAGFRQGWLGGTAEHEDGQITYELLTGLTGYLLLEVGLPDGTKVYEYANMAEFLEARVNAILTEKGLN